MAEVKTSISITDATNWITSALTTSLGADSHYIQDFENDQIRRIALCISVLCEDSPTMTKEDVQAEIEAIRSDIDVLVDSVKVMEDGLRDKARQAILRSVADNLGKVLDVVVALA